MVGTHVTCLFLFAMLLFLCTILYVGSCRAALTRGPSQGRRRGPLLLPLSRYGGASLASPATGFTLSVCLFLSFLLLGAFLAVLIYLVLFGLS